MMRPQAWHCGDAQERGECNGLGCGVRTNTMPEERLAVGRATAGGARGSMHYHVATSP